MIANRGDPFFSQGRWIRRDAATLRMRRVPHGENRRFPTGCSSLPFVAQRYSDKSTHIFWLSSRRQCMHRKLSTSNAVTALVQRAPCYPCSGMRRASGRSCQPASARRATQSRQLARFRVGFDDHQPDCSLARCVAAAATARELLQGFRLVRIYLGDQSCGLPLCGCLRHWLPHMAPAELRLRGVIGQRSRRSALFGPFGLPSRQSTASL